MKMIGSQGGLILCARYSLHSPLDRLQEELEFAEGVEELEPQWNVAPTHPVLVVQQRARHRVAERVKWGVEGRLGKGRLLVNARSETATTKPTFARAMRTGRCLVPADGFYEWRGEGKTRQPYFITPADGSVFAFGGLVIDTTNGLRCVLLTTGANDAMREIHDRMPLVVPASERESWLDMNVEPEQALGTIQRPFPANQTRLKRVSLFVNSVRNEGPQLLDPPRQSSLF